MSKRLVFVLMALCGLLGGAGCQHFPRGILGEEPDGPRSVRLASYPTLLIPRWTDDGQRLVFESPFPRVVASYHTTLRQDNISIAADRHGSDLTDLIPADAPSPEPWRSSEYGPDVAGDKVVFTTTRHSCEGRRHYEIASANLDGSGYKRLTYADGSDLLPTWSPNGSMIAFVSNRVAYEGTKERAPANSGDFNYFVMDADGSNVRSLAPDIFLNPNRDNPTPGVFTVNQPLWSRSGWLVFRDWRSESLYTVHLDKPGVVVTV